MERPPLPKARRLSEDERKRIEEETLADLMTKLKLSASEIHVHVGRISDEAGNPRVSVSVSPKA